ncbi:unnamed protein product [Boreogadus saida]
MQAAHNLGVIDRQQLITLDPSAALMRCVSMPDRKLSLSCCSVSMDCVVEHTLVIQAVYHSFSPEGAKGHISVVPLNANGRHLCTRPIRPRGDYQGTGLPDKLGSKP